VVDLVIEASCVIARLLSNYHSPEASVCQLLKQYLRHYVALTAPNRAILAAIC
jgi:hypothetical protein